MSHHRFGRLQHLPLLIGSTTAALLLLIAIGLAVSGSREANDPLKIDPGKKAQAYGRQLADELAASDLALSEAECVQEGIVREWPLDDLADDGREFLGEIGWFYKNYFGEADQLVFDLPDTASKPATAVLYDIMTSCGVDLRARALRAVEEDPATAGQPCARKAATPEAMREHWEEQFAGFASPSAYELHLQSSCQRSLEELLTPGTPSSLPTYRSIPETEGEESFCGEQFDLIWQMYRDGELSQRDFDIQLEEIEDSCTGW
jgi:hypothetical protein